MKGVPRSRYLVFFSIALAGCLIDLGTKTYMFDWLGMPREQPVWWLWESILGFETSLNEGALFGVGQGYAWLFSALSVVAMLGILVWLFYYGEARMLLPTIALGCILAGILGNLYDRLGFPGLIWKYANELHDIGDPVYAVRDWIKMIQIGDSAWPTYNIADALLVVGAGLLFWHAFHAPPENEPES